MAVEEALWAFLEPVAMKVRAKRQRRQQKRDICGCTGEQGLVMATMIMMLSLAMFKEYKIWLHLVIILNISYEFLYLKKLTEILMFLILSILQSGVLLIFEVK